MTAARQRCDATVAWTALKGHYQAHGRDLDLREAFARDPGRFDAFALEAPEVFADLSKNRWDLATRKLLIELARECRLEERRDAMLSGAPINSYITSGFGGRADPINGGGQFHKGIDFEANVGDPVRVVADGVVSFAGVKSGYGNVVDVDHGNGYVTRYAHNSRLVVKVGDLVRVGQEIAKAGSTGRSTGAHVHFEVWEGGRVVNPRKFLGKGPTPVGVVKRG